MEKKLMTREEIREKIFELGKESINEINGLDDFVEVVTPFIIVFAGHYVLYFSGLKPESRPEFRKLFFECINKIFDEAEKVTKEIDANKK